MKNYVLSIALIAPLLSACDVSEYVAKERAHAPVGMSGQLQPKANQIMPRTYSAEVTFKPGSIAAEGLSLSQLSQFQDQGVQSVRVSAPARDSLRDERSLALVRHMRGLGIEGSRIVADTDAALESNTYNVTVMYLDAVLPSCPNWSDSATHSYTNMPFSQMGCSSVNNLGAMVRDPNDMLRGSGKIRPDNARTQVILEGYHSNDSSNTSSTSSDATSTTSSNASSDASSSSGSAAAQ